MLPFAISYFLEYMIPTAMLLIGLDWLVLEEIEIIFPAEDDD